METTTHYEANFIPKGTEHISGTTASGACAWNVLNIQARTFDDGHLSKVLAVAQEAAKKSNMVLLSLTKIRKTVVFEAVPQMTIKKY